MLKIRLHGENGRYGKARSAEVQVVCTVLSTDRNHDPDIAAMLGTSAALAPTRRSTSWLAVRCPRSRARTRSRCRSSHPLLIHHDGALDASTRVSPPLPDPPAQPPDLSPLGEANVGLVPTTSADDVLASLNTFNAFLRKRVCSAVLDTWKSSELD